MTKKIDLHSDKCPNCGQPITVTIRTKIDEIRKKVTVDYKLEP